jgi:hypothetical protein
MPSSKAPIEIQNQRYGQPATHPLAICAFGGQAA